MSLPSTQAIIALAERFADTRATAEEVQALETRFPPDQRESRVYLIFECDPWPGAHIIASHPSEPSDRADWATTAAAMRAEYAGYLRCLFSNPFARSTPGTKPSLTKGISQWIRRMTLGETRAGIVDPTWLTSTVVSLAEGIYAERAFDRLPILADALQDAGCDSADVLDHCRGTGPHARGCWVVDLVLGKS
jgi:hypothetical protein